MGTQTQTTQQRNGHRNTSSKRKPNTKNTNAGTPAYNEKSALEGVVLEAYRYVAEVVVVDDSNSDATVVERTANDSIIVRFRHSSGTTEFETSMPLFCPTVTVNGFHTAFPMSSIKTTISPSVDRISKRIQPRHLHIETPASTPRYSRPSINYSGNRYLMSME